MGSGVTTRAGLEYSVGTDPASIPGDIQGLANDLDAIIALWAQHSTGPVRLAEGTFWWCTDDTSANYGLNYYNGTAWEQIDTGKLYVGATAPSILYPGLMWINTFTSNFSLEYYNGSAWVAIIPGTSTDGLGVVSGASGLA